MSKRPGDPGYPANWCIHYQSTTKGDACEAGVKYDSLTRPWPCFMEKNLQPDPKAAPAGHAPVATME